MLGLPGVQQLGRTLAPGTLSAGGPERGEAGVEAPPHCYCWASAVLAGEPEPAAAVAARTAVAAAWAPVRTAVVAAWGPERMAVGEVGAVVQMLGPRHTAAAAAWGSDRRAAGEGREPVCTAVVEVGRGRQHTAAVVVWVRGSTAAVVRCIVGRDTAAAVVAAETVGAVLAAVEEPEGLSSS